MRLYATVPVVLPCGVVAVVEELLELEIEDNDARYILGVLDLAPPNRNEPVVDFCVCASFLVLLCSFCKDEHAGLPDE